LKRSVIVGIDPGVTYGIAVLDMEGKLVHLSSKKHVKRSDIVKVVSGIGRPIIIATDVRPPPKTIESIARNFRCKLWYPKKSLSSKEKVKLTKKFENKIEDVHERDALAAALKSYGYHHSIIKKIQNVARKANLGKKQYNELI